MSARWFFVTHGDVVHLLARLEGDGDIIGDAYACVEPGQAFHGIPYEDLREAGSGMLVISLLDDE